MFKETKEGQTHYEGCGCFNKVIRCCQYCLDFKEVGDLVQKIPYCKNNVCSCHIQTCDMPTKDHSHFCCFESEKPPCGQRIKHFKCCLCEKLHPDITKELHTAIQKTKEEMVQEIKDSIGYGRFGFSNAKGEVCVKLSDITNLIKQ